MGDADPKGAEPAGHRPACFDMSLTATALEITRVNEWVERVAPEIGLAPRALLAVQLCLEEAISNVARHGAADLGVKLSMYAEPRGICVQVEDLGPPFDPTAVPRPVMPTTLDDAEIGGLGIHLIRHFSAAQVYERVDGANRLKLFFDA